MELFGHSLVCIENKLSTEELNIIREIPIVIHRRINLEAIDQPRLIVLFSMTGGRMNTAGACVEGHVIGQDQ